MKSRFLGGEAFHSGLYDHEGREQFGGALAQVMMATELLQ